MQIQQIKSNENHCNARKNTVTNNFSERFSQFKEISKENILKENSEPSLAYRDATSIAQNYQNSTYIKGHTYFDDAKFAKYIEAKEGGTVCTDKLINWATTGEHQLTTEEIQELKNKYDVTNLTPQDYYDLMADLSQKNAITSSDIVSRYFMTSTTPFFENQGVVQELKDTSLKPYDDKPMKNLYESLQKRQAYVSDNRDSVNSDEFIRLNQYVFGLKEHKNLLSAFRETAQDCYEESNRYLDVIAQLVR